LSVSGVDSDGADEMSARSTFTILFNGIEDGLAFIAGAMIVFAMGTVTADVVLRIFKASLWWSFETTEFILVYIPLLTLPWLARRRAHIVIDIVTSRLSPEPARRLEIFTSALAAVVCAVVTYWGALATLTAFNRGIVNAGMVEYPRWALLIAVPLGFGLAAIEFVRIAYCNLRKAA
jgi:TRAP-type C4-dicarboxylate transport system permease small subunit